jgi:outer membrane immunogenic protein
MADCSDGHRQLSKVGLLDLRETQIQERTRSRTDSGFDMKKLLIAAAGLVAVSIAAPASAADLAANPATKAPPVAAIYDWSGFYVGINGGGGSAHACWDIVSTLGVAVAPAINEGCHDASGGTVGGQTGYRWQTSRWVFGLEAQGNWADFSGSNASLALVVPSVTNRSKIDAFGLFTGQVGYAANNLLFYMKGGAAVATGKYDTSVPVAPGLTFSSARETRWGATIGVGLEWDFAQNWSAGAEYDHLFLGHHGVDFATPAGLIARADRIGQDVDVGLVRVNYRWGGPVVAKY